MFDRVVYKIVSDLNTVESAIKRYKNCYPEVENKHRKHQRVIKS